MRIVAKNARYGRGVVLSAGRGTGEKDGDPGGWRIEAG